jgi:hypothetical protein
MTPPTYVQWAAHRLAPLFPSRRPDAGGLTLSDALEGDLHTLRLTISRGERVSTVHAVFTAAPW